MLREYFIGVVGITVFMSFALGIAYPRMMTSMRLGAGVLLICAVMLPLVDIIGDLNSNDELGDIFCNMDYETTDSAIELAFEEGIRGYLAEKYKVDAECIGVRADGFDISTLSAERIYVTLSGRAALLDYKRIEAEVAEHFTTAGECEVSIGIG